MLQRVGLVVGATVAEIPGLGSPRGSGPDVDQEGRVVFSEQGADRRSIVVWDQGTSQRTVLYESTEYLHDPEFGPDGAVAFVREPDYTARPLVAGQRERGPFTLTVMNIMNQSRRDYELPIPAPIIVAWGPDVISTTVSSTDPPQSVLVDTATGEQSVVDGRFLAWSPTGDALVQHDDRSLTVVNQHGATVRRVPRLKDAVTIFDAAWVTDRSLLARP